MRGKARQAMALVILLAAVGLGVGGYILDKQGLRLPWIDDPPYRLQAELTDAAGVMPGQGQTVRVAGVRVGDIAGVKLRGGRAVIELDLDRRYRNLIRTDATALLRPKTPLKDMFLEVLPGERNAPVAKEGWTLPVGNTLPDVDPDEILAGLDADTRDYLRLLVQGAGEGLDGRADDLQDVLRRFEPLHRDLERVSGAIADRDGDMRRLTRTLRLLTEEVAGEDDALARLVVDAQRTFRGFAVAEGDVSRSVAELPGALRASTDALQKVRVLGDELRPAAAALQQPVARLDDVNRAVESVSRTAAPLLQRDVRPFVRAVQPALRALAPAARGLDRSSAGLTKTATVLNHLFNMLTFNPKGREGPEVAGRDEGYMFLVAWGAHQAGSFFAAADAHGVIRQLTTGGTCFSLRQLAAGQPELEFLFGMTGALTDPNVCGAGGNPTRRKAGR